MCFTDLDLDRITNASQFKDLDELRREDGKLYLLDLKRDKMKRLNLNENSIEGRPKKISGKTKIPVLNELLLAL